MSTPTTTPRTTTAFLDAFNAIDHNLRVRTKSPKQVAFTQVLNRAQEGDPSLVPIVDRLILFNELRNLIVHNGTELAEPVTVTVRAIQRIRRTLDVPPRLAPAFLRDTEICHPQDPLRMVAQIMAKEDFSQLPLYDNRGLLLGVLTTAAIARWLGTHTVGVAAKLDTSVAEVVTHEEYPDAYRVFRTTDTVGRALAAFKESSDRGEPLYAIVLTENGRHNSTPKGVLTLFDVPKLWGIALGGRSAEVTKASRRRIARKGADHSIAPIP